MIAADSCPRALDAEVLALAGEPVNWMAHFGAVYPALTEVLVKFTDPDILELSHAADMEFSRRAWHPLCPDRVDRAFLDGCDFPDRTFIGLSDFLRTLTRADLAELAFIVETHIEARDCPW